MRTIAKIAESIVIMTCLFGIVATIALLNHRRNRSKIVSTTPKPPPPWAGTDIRQVRPGLAIGCITPDARE